MMKNQRELMRRIHKHLMGMSGRKVEFDSATGRLVVDGVNLEVLVDIRPGSFVDTAAHNVHVGDDTDRKCFRERNDGSWNTAGIVKHLMLTVGRHHRRQKEIEALKEELRLRAAGL